MDSLTTTGVGVEKMMTFESGKKEGWREMGCEYCSVGIWSVKVQFCEQFPLWKDEACLKSGLPESCWFGGVSFCWLVLLFVSATKHFCYSLEIGCKRNKIEVCVMILPVTHVLSSTTSVSVWEYLGFGFFSIHWLPWLPQRGAQFARGWCWL